MGSITQILKTIARKSGVDKSIAYSSGARIVQAFTGMASIFFIAQFLTKTEQGFYYTFGSIIGLGVFFELGLSSIITQYVAHEASHLNWKEDNITLEGPEKNHSRIAYLLRFTIKWYSIIGIIFFIFLIGAGIWFFDYHSKSEENSSVSWFIPWILLCVGSILNFFISPLLSIFMGLDKVKDVMKMRFYQQVIMPAANWIGFILGFNLYVLGIAYILSAIYVIVYCTFNDFKKILINLLKKNITEKVSYMNEIFPFQWRLGVSWISSYFIFQLFTPVLFASHGAVVAGQMGLTLSVLNGINAFAISWITTKSPLFSRLIAKKEYRILDITFSKTMRQMLVVMMGLIIVMLFGIWFLRFFEFKLGDRFLPFLPIIFLIIAILFQQIGGSRAVYLRCHKKEPLMWFTIVSAILTGLSTIFLGKYFGALGMSAGYAILTFTLYFWNLKIFRECKAKWHKPEPVYIPVSPEV